MKYIDLVRVYEKLESTTKRLEKTYHISNLLKKTGKEELKNIILLLQGKVFPGYDDRKIGVAAKLIVKALSVTTGHDPKEIEEEWKKTGDLGDVAKNLISKKRQQTLFSIEITVAKVCSNIKKLATIEGAGSVDIKIKLIAELLTSARPEEAKYITRTILETLRVGIGAGSIRDAIVWSNFPKIAGIFYKCKSCGELVPKDKNCIECGAVIKLKYKDIEQSFEKLKILKVKDVSELKNIGKYDIILAEDEKSARIIYNYFIDLVQKAYDMTNDYAKVAMIAKEKGRGGLLDIDLTVGVPINVMLYKKAKDIKEAFKTVGTPCACEYKYDGFRIQVHRKGKDIKLITRRLEDVTDQFPDVKKIIDQNIDSTNFIIDCEVIGIDPKTKKWLPFQRISQRIKRKYDIENIIKEIPVIVKIFDAMEINGKNLLNERFEERRKQLNKIVKEEKNKLTLAKQIITDNEKEAKEFYEKSLRLGNEGMMMKNLEAPYKPGSRVGYGVKIKPVLESLDLVIIEAEWGEGKRSGWLTSFTLACIDEDGNFLGIGKAGTGLKEKEEQGLSFGEITEELKPLIIAAKGKKVKVKPEIVLEVHYEEIQKSTNYKSGFALRFPRIRSKRDDRRAEEISSIEQVNDIYKIQKGK